MVTFLRARAFDHRCLAARQRPVNEGAIPLRGPRVASMVRLGTLVFAIRFQVRFEEDLGVEGLETGRHLVHPRRALAGRVTWAYRYPSDGDVDMQVISVNEDA